MGRRRCCCGCPLLCMEHGGSFLECGLEVLAFYNIVNFNEVKIGSGSECAQLPGDYLHKQVGTVAGKCPISGGNACWWLDNDGSIEYEWALYICSTTEAYVYLYLPSRAVPTNVIVWKADPGYDPLCDSFFTYDPDNGDDNPPNDCWWYKKLCVGGNNGCCDDERSTTLPSTLKASFTHCCGASCDLSVDFDLVWDNNQNAWIGTTPDLCGANTSITFKLYCDDGPLTGCGGAGSWTYKVEADPESDPGLNPTVEVQNCTCDPFGGTGFFSTIMADLGWCAAECGAAGTLTFVEPLE